MTQQIEHPSEFFIPAPQSIQACHTRTLKSGDTFGVFDAGGDVTGGPGSTDGLYFRDTRHLSELTLLIGGKRPILLSSTLRDDNAELTCDLANPDFYGNGQVVLEHDVLHIRRSRFLWDGTCFERLSVHSFAQVTTQVRLGLHFAADFTDLFECRGMQRADHGEHLAPQWGPQGVTLAYAGLDGKHRTTRLRFDPAPVSLDGQHAAFAFGIAPGATRLLFVEVACNAEPTTEAPSRAFSRALLNARRRLRLESGRAAAIVTSNEVFNEAMRRSVGDLYMLVTDKETGAYPYAGVPWFSAAFGRDALITALQTLWLDPSVTRGVLAYLAKNQATASDPAADAEPGKILHEVRHGEMAELGEVPFRRYYGSVDSTPLFVMLAGAYVERTGDLGTAARLWPSNSKWASGAGVTW